MLPLWAGICLSLCVCARMCNLVLPACCVSLGRVGLVVWKKLVLNGGRAGANPPVPRVVCPAPSQLHHAASSVVGPLERYKALWMLSAQTTHWPPSRDYCSLNEVARRRIQCKRRRRRRRRHTILQQERHSLKGRGHRQSWYANQQRLGTTPWEQHVQRGG